MAKTALNGTAQQLVADVTKVPLDCTYNYARSWYMIGLHYLLNCRYEAVSSGLVVRFEGNV